MKLQESIKKLQALPEAKKKIIFFTVMSISAVILLFFLFQSTKSNLSKIVESVKSVDLPKIDFPQGASNNLSNIKDALNGVSQAVADSNLQTDSWKTYTNTEYGFEIKYPDNFKIISYYKQIFYAEYSDLKLGCNTIDKYKPDELVLSQEQPDSHNLRYKKSVISINGIDGYKEEYFWSYMGKFSDNNDILFPYKTGSIVCSVYKVIGGNKGTVLIDQQESIIKASGLFAEGEKELSNQIISTFKFIK